MLPQSHYCGRFAPSPSGPLHLGSLATALASYLDAKCHQGHWRVRIEDIDPPREVPGADRHILSCLHQHGLEWDGPVLYQSDRKAAYDSALCQLRDKGLTYFCGCNRQRLQALNGHYDGDCRDRALTSGALRLNLARVYGADRPCGEVSPVGDSAEIVFVDGFKGLMRKHLDDEGDGIVHRKDQLYAYQLAVVVDDAFQGITHVVRGEDLLPATFFQMAVYRALGLDAACPEYTHIPLVCDTTGRKLSKQNGAPALNPDSAYDNLRQAVRHLGLGEAPACGQVPALLQWALPRWQACRAAARSP